jgi:hypothetical protein
VEPSNDHPAVQVLLAFFAEMNAWETEMSRHHHSTRGINTSAEKLSQDRAIQRKRLEEIFEKYCEVGAKCERLEDEGLSFNLDSPEHDPEKEMIESVVVKPGKVIVETKQPLPTGWRYRYEVVDCGGAWRVRDNRKYSSAKNPTWRKHLL